MKLALATITWVVVSGPVVGLLLRSSVPSWSAMLGYHITCLVLAWLLRGRRRLRRPTGAFVWWLAAVPGLVTLACSPWMRGWDVWSVIASTWSQWGVRPPMDVGLVGYFVLVNPWVEEAFWRAGILGDRLTQVTGTRAALALSILGFVPFHVVVLWMSGGARAAALAGCIAFAGAFWAVLFRYDGRLRVVAWSHQAVNLALAVFYFLALRQAT